MLKINDLIYMFLYIPKPKEFREGYVSLSMFKLTLKLLSKN